MALSNKSGGPRKPVLGIGPQKVDFHFSFVPPVGTGVLTGSNDIFHGCSGSKTATGKYEIYPVLANGGQVFCSVDPIHSSSTPGYSAVITSCTSTKLAFQLQTSGSLTDAADKVVGMGTIIIGGV